MHRFLVLVGLVRDDPDNTATIEHRWAYQVLGLIVGVAVVVVIVKVAS